MSTKAMELARSVISSINAGKQHALTVNDETVFWQREEWVRWALDEVLPQIEEALAKQEQGEPVAYTNGKAVILAKHWTADYPPEGWEPLGYITPQPAQKPWVGIDDEEIRQADHRMVEGAYHHSFKQGVRWAEYKLKERNT